MNFALYLQIRLMRFFWRIKPSDKRIYALSANACPPFFGPTWFRYAKKPACFVARMRAALVLYITRSRYVSKIVKSIVLRIPDNVINIIQRPMAGYVHPRKSASSIRLRINPNDSVPVGSNVSCNSSRNYLSASFNFPSKNSRFQGVTQNIAQLIKCNFIHALSLP